MRANSHVPSSTDQGKGKEGEIGSRHEPERGAEEKEEEDEEEGASVCFSPSESHLSLSAGPEDERGRGWSVVYGTKGTKAGERVIEGVESCQVPAYTTKSQVNTQIATECPLCFRNCFTM